MGYHVNLHGAEDSVGHPMITTPPQGDRVLKQRADCLALGEDLIGVGCFDHSFKLPSNHATLETCSIRAPILGRLHEVSEGCKYGTTNPYRFVVFL
jgi:hypothetical protein